MLKGCASLTDLKLDKILKLLLDLSDCSLTHASALFAINGLAKETYVTLSKDEIKLAEDKNWKIRCDLE